MTHVESLLGLAVTVRGDFDEHCKMNVWLHKQVMQKLAENGGKVPGSLRA